MTNSDINALYNGIKLDWDAIEADDADPFRLQTNPTDLSEGELIALALFITKGRKMEQMMLATDSEAGAMLNPPQKYAASTMTNPNLLSHWGYIQEQSSEVISDVLSTLSALNLHDPSPQLGDPNAFIGIAHFHREQFEKDGYLYYPLLASYGMLHEPAKFYQAMNPTTGVIVACSNTSPMAIQRDMERYRSDHLDDEEEEGEEEDGWANNNEQKEGQYDTLRSPLADLRHWSDVAYLQWLCVSDTPKKLTCVLRHMVINEDVKFVVGAINRRNKTGVTAWPGHSYEAGTEEYYALLGTPNGASTAYLLAQHKDGLGWKTVERVVVFQERGDLDYSIAFFVGDVVEDA